MLALLHFLTSQYRENALRVFTEAELIVALSDQYEGAAAARTLRNDLRALRRRDLVVTNQPHPDHVRQRGVRRGRIEEKEPELHFSDAEHEALQTVRRALGGRLPRGP